MKIYSAAEYPQLSDQWFRLRRGVPTASCFDKIITPVKGGLSKTADGYINQLVGEHFCFDPAFESHVGMIHAVKHGRDTEATARSWYAFDAEAEVRQVGFVTTDDGRFGCSPDGLILHALSDNDASLEPTPQYDGGLELKAPQPPTHTEYLLAGVLPDAYKPQVHGQLVVTGLPWVDFVSYCPGFPRQLRVRVEPDGYTKKVAAALEQFWERLQAALAKVKGGA